MAEMQHSKRNWDGEFGFIDGAMLTRYLNDVRGPIYYIAGPPAMVTAMKKMLIASGVDKGDIRTDEFAGY